MKAQIVPITPKMAEKWLSDVPSFQRKLRQTVVDRYASDMDAGHWVATHQGIAFDTKGRLIDGQHRLAAIVKHGEPVKMMVFEDVASAAYDHVDIGFGRTLTDIFKASGDEWITTEHAAMVRMLNANGDGAKVTKGYSPYQIKAMVDVHKNAIHFVLQNCERKVRSVTTAPVLAAIASAYYGEADRVTLAAFIRILVSGIATDPKRDATVIALRDWLRDSPASGSSGFRMECYLKTQRVIKAYIKNERLSKLYTPSEPIYLVRAA